MQYKSFWSKYATTKYIGWAVLGLTFLVIPTFTPVDAATIQYSPPPQSAGFNNLFNSPTSAECEIMVDGPACSGGAINAGVAALNRMIGSGGSEDCLFNNDWATRQNFKALLARSQPGDVIEFNNKDCQQGLTGASLTALTTVYNQRPVSAVVAIEQEFNRLVGGPDAVLAQEPYFPGTGYELLRPIQNFWGWSVTVSYSLMIIIIIGVAFGLLFRARLSGGQVVQLSSAIPNIVIAMILIPLSYPLTGVFIDAITLGTNIVHGAFFSPSGIAREVYEQGSFDSQAVFLTRGNIPREFDSPEGRGLYADDVRLVPVNVRGAFTFDFSTVFINSGEGVRACEVSEQGGCSGIINNGNLVFQLADGALGLINNFAGWLGGVIVFLVSLVTLVTAVRILWKLIQRYLLVMFIPALAPFWFITIAIPGNGMKTATQYFKLMASVSVTYIVTYTMFLATIVFSSDFFMQGIPGASTNTAYSPPLIGLGGSYDVALSNRFIFSVIALAIFLSIPSTIDAIVKALDADNPLPDVVKRPIEEFKRSANVAFRQVPGVGYTYGKTVAGGVVAGSSSTYQRFVGNRLVNPADPFSGTRAEAQIKQMKDNYQAIVSKRDATSRANPMRYFRNIQAARVRAQYNAQGKFVSGQDTEVANQGDNSIKASFDLGDTRLTDTAINSNKTGFLVIERGTDTSQLIQGKVSFNNSAYSGTYSSSTIGLLASNESKASSVVIEIRLTADGVKMASDPIKPSKEVRIPIELRPTIPIALIKGENFTFSTTANKTAVSTEVIIGDSKPTKANLAIQIVAT